MNALPITSSKPIASRWHAVALPPSPQARLNSLMQQHGEAVGHG